MYEDVDARQIYAMIQARQQPLCFNCIVTNIMTMQQTKHWMNFVTFLVEEGQINGLLTSLLSSGRLAMSFCV